jgi:dihydroorotase
MNLLIKAVRVVHPHGKIDKTETDILITNGVIAKIAPNIEAGKETETVNFSGSFVSIGWLDMKANFRDPGDEVKENIESGLAAAEAGGFTGVVLMPSTNPPIQTKADVEYLRNRSLGKLVTIYPTGTLSVSREGKDITEMFDMKNAGAVAFTDDKKAVQDSGLLLRALQYAGNINSLVISYADDAGISGKGLVNEGVPSTMAGMKGIPDFAEQLMVSRDISICEYTGSKIHFSTISTKASVELIRAAQLKGLPVTAEVCAHQLFFDDTVIHDYNTNFKVKPPLRNGSDIEALKLGLKDGTIGVICSDHLPHDTESKMVEFDFAAFGIGGIETTFAAANTAAGNAIGLERLIDAFTVAPRKILGLTIPEIKEGEMANLTVFDPNLEWIPGIENMKSKGINNPFIGVPLKGKPLAVVNNYHYKVL